MVSKILAGVLILLLISFCSDSGVNPQKNSFNLSDTLQIRYKETLFNEDENISIRFEELIGEGRCPTDMMCFWEGDAELKFSIISNSEKTNFNLHTAGRYFTKDTLLYGYHIRLLEVFPYPHSKIAVVKENYRAELIIEKIED